MDGFLRSFGLMTRVMQQVEKQGGIKRQPADGKVVPEPAAVPPTSTNFK